MTYIKDLSELLIDATSRKKTIPIWCVQPSSKKINIPYLNDTQKDWLKNREWSQKAKNYALIPDDKGGLDGVVFVPEQMDHNSRTTLSFGQLPPNLPNGNYELVGEYGDENFAVLSWLLGCYKFQNYLSSPTSKTITLKLPKNVDRERSLAQAEAMWMGRDIINTPANHFGPEELETVCRDLAKYHKAKLKVCVGDKLLKENFPLIHAVGKASTRAPRLMNMHWGDKTNPLVTLIGKGICFDTGGLNIKTGNHMLLMKKDMGGAATTLALAHMIMSAQLPIQLRVLIPAAENSIAGNAFRPGDILPSRQGMNVEIGNTDAEGRLVLADALALASEENPEHIMTFATLTGAARVALGADLPAFFCSDDNFSEKVISSSMEWADPVWRLPFWQPYDSLLSSNIADVNHISSGGFAGAITAALFLKHFVPKKTMYSHFDLYGWTPNAKPGRPKGGEPQGARAVFETLERIYAK
ncbi:MAG: leucyl aminopeptidase family protein [Pseudomonadota bacterium]